MQPTIPKADIETYAAAIAVTSVMAQTDVPADSKRSAIAAIAQGLFTTGNTETDVSRVFDLIAALGIVVAWAINDTTGAGHDQINDWITTAALHINDRIQASGD